MGKGLPRSLSGGPNKELVSLSLGSPAVGAPTAVMAAFTDNASYHRFYNAAAIWSNTDAKRITATTDGTAADIKAVQIVVVGTDSADAPLTETFPVFTVNTKTTATSVGSFKTITSITIPAHDGTGATTSVGVLGGGVADVIPAWTDVGAQAIHKTATVTSPAVARNITATTGGTNTDVKAIQPIIVGKDRAGAVVSETLPAFTVNVNGLVAGAKAFKTITYIDLPVHDGTGATTAFGHGAILGLDRKLSRNTVLAVFLAGVREATAPTVAVSSTELASNTVTLSTTLDGTAVIVDLYGS